MELKMRINKTISSAQSLGSFDVSDESKVRFVVEGAGAGNVLEIRARLYGQQNFTLLKQIVGATTDVINVFTYEEMEVECTSYDSTTNEITIIAASFNEAGGSAIESIGVPSGDTLTDIVNLTLISSDNSVNIFGDNLTKSIDFTTSASAAPYSPSDVTDWSPAPTTVSEGLDQLADRTTTIENDLPNKIDVSQKGAPDGVAPLNGSSKIDSIYLPSYVDDIEEYASLAVFPLTGETGKIYVALDTNLIYRWSGSTYVQVSESAVLSVNTKVGVVVLDKTDIGLGNVDNTSDLDKPISNATQSALDDKVNDTGDTMTGPLNMSALGENVQFSVYGLNASSDITIRSDDTALTPTGNVKLQTGDASGANAAGTIYLFGGNNVDGNPANIYLKAGQSSGIGVNGSIILDSKQVVYLNQNPAGYVDAVNHTIQNVNDPIGPQDAATKKWVEDMSAIDGVLFVSPSASIFGADGSLYRPYVTIADALAAASNGNVIALLPGTYSESTVIIPSSLSSLVIQGSSAGSTTITNGISYTLGASDVDLLVQKLNVGTFTLDASSALSGLLNFKQTSLQFDRSDTNVNVFCTITESTCFGATLEGNNNLSEVLIITPLTINSGLAIFENCKFVATAEAYGNCTVRILDGELFGASAFVNGNIVGIDSPTIQIDPASDALGSLTGYFTKTLLAQIPLTNVTQSGASFGEFPIWDGSQWIPGYTDAGQVTYTPATASDWSPSPASDAEALDQLANRTTQIENSTGETQLIFTDTKEPTGFVNRTDSVISFDDGSRTFTIQPTGSEFFVYHLGVKTGITSPLSQAIPPITGSYYFYINNAGGLAYTTTFDLSLITDEAYCAYIYWSQTDANAIIVGDERHGITMDGATHGYLHTTRGTQLVSGASIGYSIGGDTISLSDMQIKDEDITANISNAISPSNPFEQILSPTARIPIIYRDGTDEWRKWIAATSHPMVRQPGDVRASYNNQVGGVWQLTEAPSNNKVLVTYIFATTSIIDPVIGILGQSQYNNIDEARGAASWDNISFGDLPAPEMKLLYTIYYETSSSFSSTVKSQITYVSDLRFTHDREVSATIFNSDHANLSGLAIGDDHPQYLNTTRGDLRYYTQAQIDSSVIFRTGFNAFTGDQSMGGNKLTNLANPVALTDAVNLQTLNAALGSSGDIYEKSFSLSNNQPSASNITDFVFPNAAVRSFDALVSVYIDATSSLYETFEIRGIQKGSDWFISISSEGDNSQIILSITSSGQMQYISANYPGFVSGTLKFRAITTSI